ncbi:hypothetical protein Ancab_009015 [Ancistrocladus abbreviatus]
METRGVTQGGDKSSPGMSSPLNIAQSTEIMSKEQDHESGQGRMRAPRRNTRDEGKDSAGDIPKEKEFAGAEKQRDTPRGSHVGDCSTSKERVVESTESSIPVGTNIDIAREDSFLPGSGMADFAFPEAGFLVFSGASGLDVAVCSGFGMQWLFFWVHSQGC